MDTTQHRRASNGNTVSAVSQRLAARAAIRLQGRLTDERGDVPGWVMITVMSAVLVAALTRFVEPALTSLFTDAVDRVKGQG